MNISQTLSAVALAASLACPAAAHTRTSTMMFYYFREVVSQKYPNRPVQAGVTQDAQGHEQYMFFDQRRKETFHDGAQIQVDFAQVLAGGTQQRPGTARYTLPPLLNTSHANAGVYFTPEQRTQAADLGRELLAWRHLLRTSPVILTAADVEPNSVVSMGGGGIAQPVIVQRFTASGTKMYAAFTRAHVGEIVGIVVDDEVISAPFIEEPILDGEGEISGGFASLAEAKDVADQMNAAVRAASEP